MLIDGVHFYGDIRVGQHNDCGFLMTNSIADIQSEVRLEHRCKLTWILKWISLIYPHPRWIYLTTNDNNIDVYFTTQMHVWILLERRLKDLAHYIAPQKTNEWILLGTICHRKPIISYNLRRDWNAMFFSWYQGLDQIATLLSGDKNTSRSMK